MTNKWISWGAILALTAVALGAFGAHGLKAVLSPERLDIFHTGVRYQFYHAFALLFLGLWSKHATNQRFIKWAGTSFLLGILFFSGSLYALSVRDWLDWPVAWLGPITPLGGLLFMVGWALVFLGVRNEE